MIKNIVNIYIILEMKLKRDIINIWKEMNF